MKTKVILIVSTLFVLVSFAFISVKSKPVPVVSEQPEIQLVDKIQQTKGFYLEDENVWD